MSRRFNWSADSSFVVLAALALVMPATANPGQQASAADKIPVKVVNALKARFPNPEIRTWTRETEGGIVLYDIEFSQGGRKLEADIAENGTILNWEKQIEIEDLPATVVRAVNVRYRNAAIKEAMAVTVIKNGKDELEGYEVVLETAGKKNVELTVAPDGKVLEDSTQK